MRRWHWLSLLLLLACSHAPAITERIIAPQPTDQGMLRAKEAKDDLPISHCIKNVCYALSDADFRSIKKYVVSLEERLKACEEGR